MYYSELRLYVAFILSLLDLPTESGIHYSPMTNCSGSDTNPNIQSYWCVLESIRRPRGGHPNHSAVSSFIMINPIPRSVGLQLLSTPSMVIKGATWHWCPMFTWYGRAVSGSGDATLLRSCCHSLVVKCRYQDRLVLAAANRGRLITDEGLTYEDRIRRLSGRIRPRDLS